MERKMNMLNMHALEVNSYLGSTISNLIDAAISTEDGIDLMENICDVDILVGEFYIEYIEIQNITLHGFESLLKKITEDLIEGGFASPDQLHDNKSILGFLSGSYGYKHAYGAIAKLTVSELSMLIAWMYAHTHMRFYGFRNLTIGIRLEEGSWKKSSIMSIKIRELIGTYYSHKEDIENSIDKSITIVPSYYWIQKIKCEMQ